MTNSKICPLQSQVALLFKENFSHKKKYFHKQIDNLKLQMERLIGRSFALNSDPGNFTQVASLEFLSI